MPHKYHLFTACNSCPKGSKNITHIGFPWQAEALGSEKTLPVSCSSEKNGTFANKSQSRCCQQALAGTRQEDIILTQTLIWKGEGQPLDTLCESDPTQRWKLHNAF